MGTLPLVMLWSLSYHTYDSITVCSLGTLVISGVAGAAIFLGISQSGGWRLHAQVGTFRMTMSDVMIYAKTLCICSIDIFIC